MKRKLLAGIISVLGISACALGVSACKNDHEHAYSQDWSSGTDCHWHESVCGHEDAFSEKEEHVWDGGKTVAQTTHETDGEVVYSCIVCGYMKTQRITANENAHTFSKEWDSDATDHWHAAVCGHSNLLIDKAKHEGEWVKALEETCTEDGREVFVCSVCGYSSSRTVEATGHTYSEEWSSDATAHWHAAACGDKAEAKDLSLHNFENGRCTECGYSKDAAIVYELSQDGSSYIIKDIGKYAEKQLNLPAEHDGKPVTAIADYAFSGSAIEEAVLPYGLQKIGKNAFYNCQSLKKVSLPDTVGVIGEYAFSHCTLLDGIAIPFGVTEIADGAFYNCSSLKNAVILGSNVTTIGKAAFALCSSLSSFNVPYSVSNVNDSAFSECTNLTSVRLPDSLNKLGKGAFFNCSSLVWVNIPKGITAIESNLFNYCTSLANVVIPENVTSIGNYAFSECSSLQSVILPAKITSVGEAAFANCSQATYVSVGDKITSVGNYAFSGCNNIAAAQLPTPSAVFAKIPKTVLRSVKITGGTTVAGMDFSECVRLESIEIPKEVSGFTQATFQNCVNLKDAVIPGGAAAYIPKAALMRVTILGGLIINNEEFKNCTTLEEVIIGEGVTAIGNGAFENCARLTEINFPESLKTVGNKAFSGCVGLESASLPEGVTAVLDNAFEGCASLKNLSLPETLTVLAPETFKDCVSLAEVILPEGLTAVGDGVFENCYGLVGNIFGNAQYLGSRTNPYLLLVKPTYQSIYSCEIHSDTKFIHSNAFAGCINLTEVSIPQGIVSVGTGAFNDCPITIASLSADMLDYINRSALVNVEITGGSAVSEEDFYYCENLTSVILPESITSIGEQAFYGCGNLSSINIPDAVTSIGDRAFYNCVNLTSINIPGSIETIGSYAFYNCSNLTGTVLLPYGLTTVDDCAFLNSGNLNIACRASQKPSGWSESWYNYSSSDTVNSRIYWNISERHTDGTEDYLYLLTYNYKVVLLGATDTSISQIDFTVHNRSVIEIGYGAFEDCSNISGVIIPETVTTVRSKAFNNSYCKYAKLSSSAVNVGANAFNSSCRIFTELGASDDHSGWNYSLWQSYYTVKGVTNFNVTISGSYIDIYYYTVDYDTEQSISLYRYL